MQISCQVQQADHQRSSELHKLRGWGKEKQEKTAAVFAAWSSWVSALNRSLADDFGIENLVRNIARLEGWLVLGSNEPFPVGRSFNSSPGLGGHHLLPSDGRPVACMKWVVGDRLVPRVQLPTSGNSHLHHCLPHWQSQQWGGRLPCCSTSV